MTTATQALERARLGFDAAAIPRWTTAAVLSLVCLVSLWLRTRALGAGLWIDEGISVGIAHHALTAIHHLLRQDGSPPLYYMLLHFWIGWFGDGERATHVLSLIPAISCIPVSYWIARSLFGRTAGWVCAALAAIDPYLTYYGQETRMYTLAALLSLVVSYAFVRGIVEGRRRYLPLLVVSLDLLLYTHNWGLFLSAGLVVATAVYARARWRDALVTGGAVLLLYAPWIPTLLYQARHTGAPWAMSPRFYALVLAPGAVFAGDIAFGALVLASGSGLASRRRDPAAMSLLVVSASTIVIAWTESQISSSWTSRYFAVLLGPLLLPLAAGLVRSGKLGLVALALAVLIWCGYKVYDEKSNVRGLVHAVQPYIHSGDLVISTHPEQVPVLRYYLGKGFRYATQLGPVPDPRVMDWADALHRIRAATVARNLEPVLASIRPGQDLVVVFPVFRDYRAWEAPWTREVFLTSLLWTRTIAEDPRFRVVVRLTPNEILRKHNYWKPLQAVVYVRRG